MNVKQSLARNIAGIAPIDERQAETVFEIPPDEKMGDLAFPCFTLAKSMRTAPAKIAQRIAQEIDLPKEVAEVTAAGPYVNFFYNKPEYVKGVVRAALEKGSRYGSSDEGKGKTIVIDYSSVNIAKPFHIGHLMSTAIGSALYKIFSFLGYSTVGVNHLGDYGTQFGKMIAAYKLWGDDAAIERDGVAELARLYVKFHQEAESDPSLDDTAREWFKKIENKDEEALLIFNRFKDITLKEAKRLYDRLSVTFDSYAGESFYNDMLAGVADELREKGILEESEGAFVVDLSDENLPPALILKSDGSSLYVTRDIAAAEYRKKTYDPYRSLYVVAYQQDLHFKQLFSILKKMGDGRADGLEHVSFGMVSLEDGTIKTRSGNVITLEEVLNRAVAKTRDVIEQKNPSLEDKDAAAEQIGVGAVLFSALSQSRIKDVVFTFDKVLNFDGETGPYIMYTHTRCASVLSRAEKNPLPPDFSALDNDQALAVAKEIAAFPEAVKAAADKCEPFYIARSLLKLSHAFNRYYYDHRILDRDIEGTNARVALTKAVKNTLAAGLSLLGMAAPERM